MKNFVPSCSHKKYRYAILVLYLLQMYLYSYSSSIDSLFFEHEILKSDTLKCSVFHFIGKELEFYSPNLARNYYSDALVFAASFSEHKELMTMQSVYAYLNLSYLETIYFGNIDIAKQNVKESQRLLKNFAEKNLDHSMRKVVKRSEALYYMTCSIINSIEGEFYVAIGNLEVAESFYKELNDKNGLSACYNNLGINYTQLGEVDKAIYFYLKSLKIEEEKKNEPGVSACYNNIGNIYKYQKEYSRANEYYFKVLDIALKTGEKKKIAGCYGNIAMVYVNQGNLTTDLITKRRFFQKAMGFNQISLQIFQEINSKGGVAFCNRNLGRIYREIGNVENDKYLQEEHYNLSLDAYLNSLKKSEESGNKESIADVAGSISKLYVSMANALCEENTKRRHELFSKAIYYGEKAYAISKEINALPRIAVAAEQLYHAYFELNQYKKAFEFAEIYLKSTNILFGKEKLKAIANAEKKYEMEKKQLQIDNLNKEKNLHLKIIAYNRIIIVVFLFAIITILVYSVFIYRSLVQKKRANMLIEKKNTSLKKAFSEIKLQKEEIERMSGELHNADKSKLRFFSYLSHEFRTPLTLILEPIRDLLDKFDMNLKAQKNLHLIYSNTLKLQDLTNQIMELQKLDSGELKLCQEKCNLIRFCRSIISSFESSLNKKNVSLMFTSNYESVVLDIDKDKVGKVLTNLISNALKFCFEHTVIEVSLQISTGSFKLSVSDKGIGIPQKQLEQVFRRYFQADTNKYFEGIGLGLSYVKELVDFMQGEVDIYSQENQGTTVSITLPLGHAKIINNAMFTLSTGETSNKLLNTFDLQQLKNKQMHAKSILVVEDNTELLEFIKDLFVDKFIVLLASDGEEGARIAGERLPDIIISDIMMPNLDGYELCSNLKNNELTSHIPVILLTAKDNVESNFAGYQYGVDDYLIKPFDSRLLKMKVTNMLKTRDSVIKQYRNNLVDLPEATIHSNVDRKLLKKCIQLIEFNMANSGFTIEQMASDLGFSRRNLYRKIQLLTGFNPAELIRNIRMQYAVQLLRGTNKRIYEVAGEVGYENATKFSKAFKKHHGMLPSEISS